MASHGGSHFSDIIDKALTSVDLIRPWKFNFKCTSVCVAIN